MDNIRNYVQLRPKIATSGQPTEEQFRDISKAGYVVVINLAFPGYRDCIDNEGKIVTELGMAYFHLPIPFDNPTAEHVRLFCNIMSALKGNKIWVHCVMNYRVSVFMFHYLHKIEKLNKEESISPIFNHWQPDSNWRRILALESDEIGI